MMKTNIDCFERLSIWSLTICDFQTAYSSGQSDSKTAKLAKHVGHQVTVTGSAHRESKAQEKADRPILDLRNGVS
jgi:hypothetical protein